MVCRPTKKLKSRKKSKKSLGYGADLLGSFNEQVTPPLPTSFHHPLTSHTSLPLRQLQAGAAESAARASAKKRTAEQSGRPSSKRSSKKERAHKAASAAGTLVAEVSVGQDPRCGEMGYLFDCIDNCDALESYMDAELETLTQVQSLPPIWLPRPLLLPCLFLNGVTGVV